MEYIKRIAFDGKGVVVKSEPENTRNDVFIIRNHSDRKVHKVILNENKLASIYK
jgi:hypothetical protein